MGQSVTGTDKTNIMGVWGLLIIVVLTGGAMEVLAQQVPNPDFAAQYHIQTDLGEGRFFRFQTHTGQYRKETLNSDGSQEGTYGWVDPNGVLRLFDYVADNQGYRIVKESLFKVGTVSPGATISTRGGDIELGFEVYPLDGSGAAGRAGSNLPSSRLHLPEGSLASTSGYRVTSLVSTNQELKPNPVSKQVGATFFSGGPAPPAPRKVVVGAEAAALPAQVPARDGFVVGHTASEPVKPTTQARSGIVIGLSHNTGPTSQAALPRPAPPRARSLPPATPTRRRGIVIGSSRRKRMA